MQQYVGNKKQKPRIDFIGIGAAKAATTWIHQCLSEHPEVCMADPKEPAFFTNGNREKGFRWYANHFAHCSGEKLRGEISPAYLVRKEAPRLIHEAYPDVKLIISLRDPVERFISACNFKYSLGRYNTLDFSGDVETAYEPDIRRGRYYRHLSRFLEYFNRDQIFPVFYEDIKKDPIAFMQNIFRFLGVDDTFEPPSAYKRSNVTSVNRQRSRLVRRIYYALRTPFTDSKIGRRYILPVLRAFGIVWLSKQILALNVRTERFPHSQKKEATAEERAHIRSYFEEDIQKLEKLLERDLSMWQ